MKLKQLWIWTGPVSAAKSEGALRVVKRLLRQKNRLEKTKKAILIRPFSSKRIEESENFMVTKDGNKFPCTEVNSCSDIKEAVDDGNYDIIWVDEPHFIEDEDQLYAILTELRKSHMIIISGISATDTMKPLGKSMGLLLQTADRIFSEQADCDFCGVLNSATRTIHIGREDKVSDIQLGGEESFRPACPSCWDEIQDMDKDYKMELINNIINNND